MGLQRANWLEQQLSRYKKTAILKGIKSGALSQMRWTNLSFGLTPGYSRELHNPQKAIAEDVDCTGLGLSVVRRSGSAAQTKPTNKSRKTMAANATALCARVISISNRIFRGNISRLRETHNPLSSPGCKVSRLTIKW